MARAPGTTSPTVQATRALQIAREYRKRVLDPVDRFSEVIFGLIMVLTFTGAVSVAEGGREDVRQLLVAALGCNVAWGVVDGVMYVVTSVAQRARRRLVFTGIRAADPAAARAIVLRALPEGVAAIVDDVEADRIAERVRDLPEPRRRAAVTGADLRGAVASCLLVVLATFPPTIPFLLVGDAVRALRISHALAVASLFLASYSFGRSTGLHPWLLGIATVVLAAGLVALTIALGG